MRLYKYLPLPAVCLLLALAATRAGAVSVANVTVAAISSGSLSVSWAIPAQSTPTIVLSSDNFVTVISSAPGALAQNSTGYFGLSPNTTYYFQVKDSTEADSAYSGFNASRSTATLAVLPGAAPFGTLTATTIVAVWSSGANPPGTVYEAAYSTAPDFSGSLTPAITTNTFTRFASLDDDTTYYFLVRAINHSGVPTYITDLGARATLALPDPSSVIFSGNDLKLAAVTGGNVTTLAFDPNNSFVVYAAVSGGGLFKSHDKGNSWNQAFLPTLGSHNPRHILVSSGTPDLVFVCERGDSVIWRSVNGGVSFSGSLTPSVGQDLDCLALAQGVAPGVYYASIAQGDLSGGAPVGRVYKSADSGATWAQLAVSTAGAFITDIVQLPSQRLVFGTQLYGPSGMLDGIYGGGLYYSDNDGASWTAVNGSTQVLMGLAYNGTNTLLAMKGDGVQVTVSSSPDGAAWTNFPAAYPASGAPQRQLKYHNLTDTFFMLEPNLYQSASGASNYAWPASNSPGKINSMKEGAYSLALGAPTTFAADPDNADIILGAAAGDGIFKTTDGGANWDLANTGLYAANIEKTLKSPASGYIYALASQGFVYFSTGTLSAWTRVYRTARNVNAYAITYDQANPARMYLSVSTGSFSGYDTSRTEILVNNNLPATQEDNIPFPHNGWSALDLTDIPVGIRYAAALLADGATIYAGLSPDVNAGSGQYLYKSVDSGANWQALSLTTAGGVRSLAFDPSDRRILYAGSGDRNGNLVQSANANGLYRSPDSGATWTLINSFPGEAVRKIIIDTTTASNLWTLNISLTGNSAGPNSIWESLDSGATWMNISPLNGLGFGLSDLSYNAPSGVLLAATPGSGINVYMQAPGACAGPCQWQPAFGVYGEAQALYSGSVGIGTSGGLFENRNFRPLLSSPAPAGELAALKVYPNPLRPAKGHTVMNFAGLPAGAKVKLYTLVGELVSDLTANSSGLAAWDGKNKAGQKAASGVYFAFIQNGGKKRTVKVAVQR